MSQTDRVLKHLESGKKLTPMQALNRYGCFRLGARIWDLRQRGYPIQSEAVKKDGKHFARYFMVTV